MSLLDRDEVPEPKSRASARPTVSPRVAASSATPAPTTPPPTTRTWCSVSASAASAAARSAGPSLAVTPAPAITFRTYRPRPPVASAGAPRRPRAARLAGCHHDLDPLEFLQVRVAGCRHRLAQRPHQVHRPVGHGGRAVHDLLQGADRADPHPRAARQVRMVCLAAPVVA